MWLFEDFFSKNWSNGSKFGDNDLLVKYYLLVNRVAHSTHLKSLSLNKRGSRKEIFFKKMLQRVANFKTIYTLLVKIYYTRKHFGDFLLGDIFLGQILWWGGTNKQARLSTFTFPKIPFP